MPKQIRRQKTNMIYGVLCKTWTLNSKVEELKGVPLISTISLS